VQFFSRPVERDACEDAGAVGARAAAITDARAKKKGLFSWLLYETVSHYRGRNVDIEGHLVDPFGVEIVGRNAHPRDEDWAYARAIAHALAFAHGAQHKLHFPRGHETMFEKVIG